MDIEAQLATALGHRDEQPNINLAIKLAEHGTKADAATLIGLLESRSQAVRHDAIKTAYEWAGRDPALLAPHFDKVLGLLSTKNNRMLWGLMALLNGLTDAVPEKAEAALDRILAAADRSSVIAKDNAMAILAKLNAHPDYAGIVTPVALQRLKHAAVNQTPMYAEFLARTMPAKAWPQFAAIVEARLAEIDQPAKKKRLSAVLRKGPATS
ncbi:MAG: hypothetical protein KDJ19_11450 [Hyphomicrobiaceae bacterium]|nr:hypothetical protein [Hyphomicrobiaceae bacterium]MCC0024996.1 hypothetical protein [Hyphomicrobiaceae bacterium]